MPKKYSSIKIQPSPVYHSASIFLEVREPGYLIISRTEYCGCLLIFICMRPIYSPMRPTVRSCTPEKIIIATTSEVYPDTGIPKNNLTSLSVYFEASGDLSGLWEPSL